MLNSSEGSYHIDTSVCDKSVKLSELRYNVILPTFPPQHEFEKC